MDSLDENLNLASTDSSLSLEWKKRKWKKGTADLGKKL